MKYFNIPALCLSLNQPHSRKKTLKDTKKDEMRLSKSCCSSYEFQLHVTKTRMHQRLRFYYDMSIRTSRVSHTRQGAAVRNGRQTCHRRKVGGSTIANIQHGPTYCFCCHHKPPYVSLGQSYSHYTATRFQFHFAAESDLFCRLLR